MSFIQPRIPPLPTSLDLSGKVALVTGANRTLGYATSQHLIRHGLAKLIMGVRSLKAGEAARQTLLDDAKERGQSPLPEILVRVIDMISPKSVVSFVEGLQAEGITLNIAILNAGISELSFAVSEETQFERIFQVNYVSTALLSVLLLPLLSSNDSSKPNQLCVVGSEAYNMSSYNTKLKTPESIFNEFNDPSHFRITRYSDTKYFLYLFLRRLASHRPVKEHNVQIVCTCPGMVGTDIGRNAHWVLRWIFAVILWMRARSQEDGAAVIASAGTGLAGDKAHGEMFRNMIVEECVVFLLTPFSALVTDQALPDLLLAQLPKRVSR